MYIKLKRILYYCKFQMLLFCSTTTFKYSFLAWRINILDINSNNSKKIYQGTLQQFVNTK